jgi:hypothetical protein
MTWGEDVVPITSCHVTLVNQRLQKSRQADSLMTFTMLVWNLSGLESEVREDTLDSNIS